MTNKSIKNQKDFQDFLKYLQDDNKEIKKERLEAYLALGSFSSQDKQRFEKNIKDGVVDTELLILKSQYISNQLKKYFFSVVSDIQTNLFTNEEKAISSMKVLISCFEELKNALPDSHQQKIMGTLLHTLGIKDEQNDTLKEEKLINFILSWKDDINQFNFNLFNVLYENFKDTEQATIQYKEKLINPNIVKALNNGYDGFSLNGNELSEFILSAMAASKKAIKCEYIGRVYGYISSGWAEKDLLEHNQNNSNYVVELKKIILDIQQNPDSGISDSNIKERNKKLIEVFTHRLNEISYGLDVSIKKGLTGFILKNNLNEYGIAGKGRPDLAIMDTKNNKLLLIYCTANPALVFTEKGVPDFNTLRQANDITKKLEGQKLSKFAGFQVKPEDDTLIKTVETVLIAPGLVLNKEYKTKQVDFFAIPSSLNDNEIKLISYSSLFKRWVDNKEKEGEDKSIITSLDKVIMLGLDHQYYSDKMAIIKSYKKEEQYGKFLNLIFIPYLEEVAKMFKERGVETGIKTETVEHRTNNEFFHNILDISSFALELVAKDLTLDDKEKLLTAGSILFNEFKKANPNLKEPASIKYHNHLDRNFKADLLNLAEMITKQKNENFVSVQNEKDRIEKTKELFKIAHAEHKNDKNTSRKPLKN